jgi:F0F1-type ATP synthase assembly protein I
MSDTGNGAVTPASRAQKRAAAQGRAEGLEVGWTVSGYLISGMLAYGIIGWLIGRAVHIWFLLPVGMLVGLAISIGFIIYRYGVQGAAAQPRTRAKAPREMTGDR